jgi:RimJ/RimL family protein N-acetyltransferase/ketosteroid isomerase-like protein
VTAQAGVMDRLAGQVRRALESADLDTYAGLLDRAVRWGAPGDPVPPCRSREQVLAWYRRARDSGTRTRVTDTLVAGDKILVGLKVTRPASAGSGTGEVTRWQVLTVRGGRITAIDGFAARGEAEIWAGLAPPRPDPPGAIRWAAPARHQLADDRIGLRLPEAADAAILHGYTSRDGGLDGGWVPLPADATRADCRAVVADWLAGWRNERSFHGPALIITPAGEPALAGLVGLGDRGGRVVELSYGVAPDRRGRGYATSAARLAAGWLLRERHADLVELGIGAANTASQRAALAAGFTPAGTVQSSVATTGDDDGDLRFILRRP